MIRSGAAVVIAGAPNAGKSSLFNALAGTRRAIVTEVPGTTRDALELMLDIGPWPVRLVDTAGLRASDDIVERLGIEVAERHVKDAAIVLVCGENTSSLEMAIKRASELTNAILVAIGTKSDTGAVPTSPDACSLIDPRDASVQLDYVPVSAHTGEGLAVLVQRIVEILNRNRQPMSANNPVLTRERHRMALSRAREEIVEFVQIRSDEIGLPTTVTAVHLHSARGYMEELVGVLDIEEVLDRVFSTFCVGK
jgi:tRNA modification GTPase